MSRPPSSSPSAEEQVTARREVVEAGFKFGSVIGALVADRLDGATHEAWWPALGYGAIRAADAAGRAL